MKTGNEAYRVGISGSYGGLNLGDEAILESIIDGLRSSLPVEITVFSRNAANTLRSHKADRAIPVRRLSYKEIAPEVERLDLLIIGGGGILFDKEADIYLREAAIAQEKGIPVMTYAIGAGPLDDPSKQHVVRQTLNKTAAVTVRDRIARRVLEEAGVTRDITVTADPAFLLKPAPLPPGALRHEGLHGKKNLIGFSVREPGPAAPHINKEFYHSLLANAADYLIDRYDAHVVFVPMEPNSRDLQHSHLIISDMVDAQRATVLKESYTPGQMLTLMNHFVFALGMRLHFLMFAAMNGIPFVALPYASKVSGFLDALGIEAPPLRHINQGKLIAYIDNAWDHRLELITRMKEVLPELIKQSMRTNETAVKLLRRDHRREIETAGESGKKKLLAVPV
jgi:polysaccharide pyruvyl transferase CsaB